jgi:6-phosphogluconate dehydrogenase
MATAQIGLFGLAVMGQNLALNIAEHGVKIAVCNRSPSKVRARGPFAEPRAG